MLAMLGATIPPLLVLPIAPIVRRSLHRRGVRGAMQGIGLGLRRPAPLGRILASCDSSGVGLPPAFAGSLALAALGFALSWTGNIYPVMSSGRPRPV